MSIEHQAPSRLLSSTVPELGFEMASLRLAAEALGICFALAAWGWPLTCLFGDRSKQPLFLAPIAGLSSVTLLALSLHVMFDLTGASASWIACGVASAGGLIAIALTWSSVRKREAVLALLMIGLLVIAIASVIGTPTLMTGSRAFMFADGTDQAGYAHLAAWFLDHRPPAFSLDPVTNTLRDRPPFLDPSYPYDSWPQLMARYDPRFGAHVTVALTSFLSGHDTIFAYDLALIAIITAQLCALAYVFLPCASLRTGLVALFVIFLTSQFFNYAKAGFLGKLLAYPLALTCAALVWQIVRLMQKNDSRFAASLPLVLVLLMFLGIVHSGAFASALLLFLLLAMLATVASRIEPKRALGIVLLCVAIAAIPFAVSGVVARPILVGYNPPFDIPWTFTLSDALDFDNVFMPTRLDHTVVRRWIEFAVHVVVFGGVSFVAWQRRDRLALTILAGLMAWMACSIMTFNRYQLYQSSGLFYLPLALIALRLCLARGPKPSRSIVAICLAVLVVSHLPKASAALDRYVLLNGTTGSVYDQRSIERIRTVVQDLGTEIFVNERWAAIMALVEFGKHRDQVTWSDNSYRLVVEYRSWRRPDYPSMPTRLIDVTEPIPDGFVTMFETRQYRMLRRL